MATPKVKVSRKYQPVAGASGRDERLYQELARSLIAAIEAGTYRVGERLPGERELAAEYNVSRPTLREAMIALEVQGLVEVRVGSGAYVRQKPDGKDDPGFNVTAFDLSAVMDHLLFSTEERAVEAARRSVQHTKARFGKTRA